MSCPSSAQLEMITPVPDSEDFAYKWCSSTGSVLPLTKACLIPLLFYHLACTVQFSNHWPHVAVEYLKWK